MTDKVTPGEVNAVPEMPIKKALEFADREHNRIGNWVPDQLIQYSDEAPHAAVRLAAEVRKLQNSHGCLIAGPGRGDCSHFIGMPTTIAYPETVDIYGRPNRWCQVCWNGEQIRRFQENMKKLAQDFDQSEKENKIYNKILAGLRPKLNDLSADVANWVDNERTKELGKHE